MRTLSRAFVLLVAFAASVLAFGFLLFATNVMRNPTSGGDKADGIVVLTGGDSRIQVGARLLKDGRARRMLISGVNRKVSRTDILRIANLDQATMTCCVDLGYEALDTVGNADETRTWANAHGYTKLLIVTSSYHMPRSLAELALAMPNVELLPCVVTPRNFPDSGWWLHIATTKLLLSEYLKFLPAMARLTAQRVMGWNEGQSVAGAQQKRADG
jgi:uncharacterized SAM-binding protein YcdF (DUF218 family)